VSRKRRFAASHEVSVYCPNEECEAEILVDYYPGSPGQMYGPPERCYEAEGPYLEAPEACPECGEKISSKDEDRWILHIEENKRWDDDRY
jgi:hypothetical protein